MSAARLTASLLQSRTAFVRLPSDVQKSLFGSGPQKTPGSVVLRLEWAGGEEEKVQRAYVGCRGHEQAPPGVVQVPISLAKCLKIEDGVRLAVTRIVEATVTMASRVSQALIPVEPVSADDWEILELNAGYVEEHLLEQVDVLTDDHTFPFWVRNSLIHFRPTVKFRLGFVKLGLGSEVAVAPKLRGTQSSTSTQPSQMQTHTSPPQRQRFHVRVQPAPSELELSTSLVCVSASMFEEMDAKELDLVCLRFRARKMAARDNDTDDPAKSPPPSWHTVVLRVAVSSLCAPGHAMLCDTLRRVWGIGLFTKAHLSTLASSSHLAVQSPSLPKAVVAREAFFRMEGDHVSFRPDPCTQSSLSEAVQQLLQTTPDAYAIPVMHDRVDGGGCVVRVSIDSNPTDVLLNVFGEEESGDGGEESKNKVSLTKPSVFSLLSRSTFANEKEEEEEQEGGDEGGEVPEWVFEDREEVSVVKDCLRDAATLAQLGGLRDTSAQIERHLRAHLLPEQRSFPAADLPPPGHVVLVGPAGVGKTALVKAVAGQLRLDTTCLTHTVVVECEEWISLPANVVLSRVERIIREAIRMAPTIVVFDALDTLVPVVDSSQGVGALRVAQIAEGIADVMSDLLYSPFGASTPSSRLPRVACVATAAALTTMDDRLRLAGLFTNKIQLSAPDSMARLDILRCLLKSCALPLSRDADLEAVSLNTEGFTGADLAVVVQRAVYCSAQRGGVAVTTADVEKGLENFTPASLQGVDLEETVVQWSDIGGLLEVKRVLKETLELPTRYARLFERAPLKLRSGLLLYGPPGCGKTMLAQSVAKECGLNLVSVKGPELLNKYIGASEEAVRRVFERAAQAQPCVLLFDEFDSIAPKRGGESTGVTDRVVNQLLTFLDGVEGRSGVYVLGATSRPDLIDVALLRPGRLDKSIYCGIPDVAERVAILEVLASKMDLSPDVDLTRLAGRCEHFTGADLNGVMNTAQLAAVHETLDERIRIRKEGGKESEPEHLRKPVVHQVHIDSALNDTRRSISDQERRRFESIYADFIGSRGPSSIKDAPHSDHPVKVGSKFTQA